jgi:hypothetical protein
MDSTGLAPDSPSQTPDTGHQTLHSSLATRLALHRPPLIIVSSLELGQTESEPTKHPAAPPQGQASIKHKEHHSPSSARTPRPQPGHLILSQDTPSSDRTPSPQPRHLVFSRDTPPLPADHSDHKDQMVKHQLVRVLHDPFTEEQESRCTSVHVRQTVVQIGNACWEAVWRTGSSLTAT